jgi:hypothetical protein
MEMYRQSRCLTLPALVIWILVTPTLAAAGTRASAAGTPSTSAVADSGPPAAVHPAADALADAPVAPLPWTGLRRGLHYGFASAAPLAGPLHPKPEELSLSARQQRLGMTGETEILAWSTGVGAVVGLTTGLREDENAIESTLKGAAMGFILPIALFAAMASTVPRAVPVSPVQPTGLTTDAGSSSRLQDNAPPLLHLRLSGQRARGQADRYVALGIGSGIRLSYVTGW